MSFLKAFCIQLENMSEELSDLFHKDVNLRTVYNSIILLRKSNPRKLYEIFMQYVLRYEKQILKKDESFFLDKNYEDELIEMKTYDSKNINIIKCLKKYWSQMSDKSKENIWLYLNVLIKLSKKI